MQAIGPPCYLLQMMHLPPGDPRMPEPPPTPLQFLTSIEGLDKVPKLGTLQDDFAD
jgi:hypothetical protein